MLVGGDGGVEGCDGHALHVLARYDAYRAGRVLEDSVVLRGIDDAHLIDRVQLVGDDAQIVG